MRSTRHLPDRQRQSGQTVIWFLATIAACCCVFALVYNVGQVTNKKEATVNAADAAALSGALIEARMLNFEAYANRAMIANEVTIAQLVSSQSFVNYANTFEQDVNDIAQFIPYVGDISVSIAQASQTATDYYNPAVEGLIEGVDAISTVLQPVALAAYESGATAANTVASNIAAANVTTFNGRDDQAPQLAASAVALGLNEGSWTSFVNSGGDDQATVAGLVGDSRDPFATQRNNGGVIGTLNDTLEAAGLGEAYFSLAKTSGTTELENFNRWSSQDSLDIEFNACAFFGHLCSNNPIPGVPVAYGRADADSDDSEGKQLCNTSAIFGGPTTNCQNAFDNPNTSSWQGLPKLLELASGLGRTDPCTTNNGSDSPSLPYVMAVEEAGQATLTTQNLGSGLNNVDVPGPQGSPRMTDSFQNGGKLTAISEACVFFLRPDGKPDDPTRGSLARGDGKHEFASLYNPYWQARLTAPDSKWIAALYTQIGQASLIPVATQ